MTETEKFAQSNNPTGAYRAVEHALAIHGDVKAALHPLDGHHSQTHGNKIKQGCRAEQIEAGRHKEAETKETHQIQKDRTEQLSLNLTLDCTSLDLWFLAIRQQWREQDTDNRNTITLCGEVLVVNQKSEGIW